MLRPNLHRDHPRSALAWISRCRAFFGHPSMGAKITRGLADLAAALEVPIKVHEGLLPEMWDEPCFAHRRIRRNVDAASKLNAFASMVSEGPKGGVDLPIVKRCYVDVIRDTDMDALAHPHDRTFDALRVQSADLTLVAATDPLTTGVGGTRGRVVWALGRPDPAEPDNRARRQFKHLSHRYAASGALFDLAALEAGTASISNGRTPALLPSLTRDGGHLNPRGRKLAAVALGDTLGKLL